MPQTSQSAEDAREDEADEREQVDADRVRPVLREDADDRGAQQPAEDDERDGDPVRRLVDVVVDLVDARVLDVDLERPVAQPLEHVVTWYGSSRAIDAERERLHPRALRAATRGWNRSARSPRAYGLRDLEHVEVGVDLVPTEASVAIALSSITNRDGSRRFSE